MAKLYKTEMYILDINDDFESLEDLINYMEYKSSNFLIEFKPFNAEVVNVEWRDDIDLNFIDATHDTYRKYFNN